MTFNALTSNNDDHPRNHAMIAPGNAWQLSPAYPGGCLMTNSSFAFLTLKR
jgi:hypothetical protein